MTGLNLAGVGVIAFFLLFILGKKKKRAYDYVLVAINVLWAGILLSDVWVKADLNTGSFMVQTLLGYYFLPAFLVYALLLTGDVSAIRKNIPWFAAYALVFTLFILGDLLVFNHYDADSLLQLYKEPPLHYHLFYKGHFLFVALSLLWFLKKLSNYQDNIRENYSFIEPIQFKWLQTYTYAYFAINAASLLTFLIYNFGGWQDIETPYAVLNAILLLFAFYLSFNGVRQYAVPELPVNQQPFRGQSPKESQKEASRSATKYQTSSLSHSEMQEIYAQILQMFESEQLYLNPKLPLQELAKRVGVSSHKVSQSLNTLARKSYFDFVNGYRVKHLQGLLRDDTNKHLTILALGLDSGFNSKASLNRIFRQHSGQSPSEYLRSHSRK